MVHQLPVFPDRLMEIHGYGYMAVAGIFPE